MMIAFTCGSCGKEFQTDESYAGKKCKCKQCGHVFVIPGRPPGGTSGPAPSRSSEPPARSAPSAPRPKPAASRPAPKPAKPARPNYLDDEDDPYAIDEPVAAAVKKTVAYDEDEEFLPPRAVAAAKPARPKKKKPLFSSSRGDYEIFDPPSGAVVALLFAGLVLCGAWSFVHSSGLVLLIGYGFLVGIGFVFYGGIGTLVRICQESFVCLLLYMFVPFYSLYYLITRWDRMRGPFLNSLTGSGFFIALALLLPAFQSARVAADRAAGRLPGASVPVPGPGPDGGMIGAPVPGDDAMRNAMADMARDMARNMARGGPMPGPGGGPPPGAPIAPPQFVPPAPPAQNNGGDSVTLIVTGLADKDSEDDFNEKLNALLQKNYGGFHSFSTGGLARKTIRVSPVPDAQALAKQIDWARVVSVNGRTIEVQARPLDPSQRRPADTEFVAQVLFDLKGQNLQRRKEALGRLANAPPDAKRKAEVAKAIEPMLKDPDGFTRSDAAKALSIWGGTENTPALVEALRDPAFNVRWAVLDAMAVMKDPAAAEPVAAFLGTNDRGKAVEALKGMGSGAESAVIKYLEHGDPFTRMEAAKILAVIGTEKSVAPLQTLIQRTNNHGLDAMAAGDALDQLGAPRFAAPARRKGSIVPRSRRN